MNIENFNDPMGGSGRGNINDGVLGIAGFAMDRDLVKKFLFKPLIKSAHRGNARDRRAWIGDEARRMRKVETAAGLGRTPAKQATASARTRYNKWIQPSNNLITRDMTSRFKTYGKNIRRIGWAFIGAAAFGAAESLMTPGISKVAARKEQAMFMDESPLDSGAAYTQRQRAMQAIFDSQTRLPSILGSEASYMHR